jgi:hypothetical protein
MYNKAMKIVVAFFFSITPTPKSDGNYLSNTPQKKVMVVNFAFFFFFVTPTTKKATTAVVAFFFSITPP